MSHDSAMLTPPHHSSPEYGVQVEHSPDPVGVDIGAALKPELAAIVGTLRILEEGNHEMPYKTVSVLVEAVERFIAVMEEVKDDINATRAEVDLWTAELGPLEGILDTSVDKYNKNVVVLKKMVEKINANEAKLGALKAALMHFAMANKPVASEWARCVEERLSERV